MGLRRELGRWEVRGCCDSLLWEEPREEILGRCDVSGVYLKLFAPFRGEWSSISILKGHLEQRLKEAEPVGARFAPQDAEGWLRRTENVLEGPWGSVSENDYGPQKVLLESLKQGHKIWCLSWPGRFIDE